jgi:hypothetical protein
MMTNCIRRNFPLLALFIGFGISPALAQGNGVTRVQQDDPSITYSGNWYANDTALHSGDAATLTNARGARATITFTGTGISWIGVADAWSGLANVHIDGRLQVLDTYSENPKYQHALFTARGLAPGPHTLSIEVTHERGPGTDGSWVWIDAFDIENGSGVPGGVTAAAGRIEENNAALTFTGRWYSNDNPALSGGQAILATDAGSRANITFTGTGIEWVAYRDEWSGVARVYLDGELKTTVDNYLSPSQVQVVPYRINGLSSGVHTLTIEATGTHNESSKGSWVWVDAFNVVK